MQILNNLSVFEDGEMFIHDCAIKIEKFIEKNVNKFYESKNNEILTIQSYLFLIDYYLHFENLEKNILQIKNIKNSEIQLNYALNYAKTLGKYSFWKWKVFERAEIIYLKTNNVIRMNYFASEANKIRTKIKAEELEQEQEFDEENN